VAGERRHRVEALFDPVMNSDPRAWLEAKLGTLAFYEAKQPMHEEIPMIDAVSEPAALYPLTNAWASKGLPSLTMTAGLSFRTTAGLVTEQHRRVTLDSEPVPKLLRWDWAPMPLPMHQARLAAMPGGG